MSAGVVARPLHGLTMFGAAAAMTGGSLRIASTFIPYAPNDAGLEMLYGVIDVCLLVGLIALYVETAAVIGVAGLVGFLIALPGLASIVGPDTTAFGVDFYRIGALVFVGGLAVMAVTLLRARVMMWAAALWVATLAAALASPVVPQAFMISGLCLGVGYVLAGLHLWRRAA